MNTQFRRSMWLPTIDDCALAPAAQNAFGPAGDPPVSEIFRPSGMRDLVNGKNRIGGVSREGSGVFYYIGTAPEFSTFLAGYAGIRDIEKHRLILHRGAGETGLHAGGKQWACDWTLWGRPGAIRPEPGVVGTALSAPYVLEVHFWTESRIAINEVVIPENIETVSESAGAN